ncbi:MAG: sigma-54-dependent transcriptional regulator [Gammaproteobacteria bacterium]
MNKFENSNTTPYILVVDDEPDIRNLLKEILEDEGYDVGVAENGKEARKSKQRQRPDLVLLDIWMPDVDGITLLKEWSEAGVLPMPVIMMSGHGTVETAVEATRLGAYDFIEKPLSLAKLLLTVEHALESDSLKRENIDLRQHGITLDEPIGKSAHIQNLRENVKRVAQHDTWVLITGEPGSGLGVIARYLHKNSNRASRPFIDVNVASLSKRNGETELFGSEIDGRITHGLLEQANGGSLYLCDIVDMDPTIQTQLLSALDTGQITRIGGSSPVEINVRILAATNYDLAEQVAANKFRKDLYFKLNVVPINVLALREHYEDIPELLNYFVARYVDLEKLPYRKFSVAAQNQLRNHNWPGNLRELENLVQRLLITGSDAEISSEEVNNALGTLKSDSGIDMNFDLPLREARDHFERAYFEHHLRIRNGSVGEVAKIAELERTHLYRKLRSLGIDAKSITKKKS